jgi:glycosyltransferase involved in cell wall biosynthesis
MKKFKVTICSLSYLPSYGGLVTYIQSLSNHLIENNRAVQIFTTDSKNPDLNEYEIYPNGLKIFRVRAFDYGFILRPFTPLVATYKIRQHLLKNTSEFEDVDLIICRHLYYAAAVNGIDKLKGKSIFLVPLSAARLQFLNRKDKGLAYKLYSYFIALQLYLIEFWVLGGGMKISTLSNSKKKELQSTYRISKSICTNQPGVDFEKFRILSSHDEKIEILNSINRSDDLELKIILVIARLVEEKCINDLISALQLIESNDVILYIIGDGPLFDTLKKQADLIDKDVIFFGRRTDVEIFYRIADCFILPSKYEGFGHVYLEAMASGCPIVGVKNNPPYTITATDEIIINNLNGYIALSHSPQDLSNAINNAIEISSLQKIRQKIRNYALAIYSWEKHFERLLDYFDK